MTALAVRERRLAWWIGLFSGAASVGKLPELAQVIAEATGEEPEGQSPDEQVAAADRLMAAWGVAPTD